MSVFVYMANSKPNLKVVEQVRSRLKSEDMYTRTAISDIKTGLESQKKNTKFYMFLKRKELSETIKALDYILNS